MRSYRLTAILSVFITALTVSVADELVLVHVKGMEHMVQLGQQLRKLYMKDVNFLTNRYHSNEIYVQSTNYNRTIISAMSALIGLYYDNTSRPTTDYPSGIWPAHFIPVAIHTLGPGDRSEMLQLLDPTSPCARHLWLWKKATKTVEYTNLMSKSQVLLQHLSNATGIENLSLESLWFPYDIIYNELLDGRPTVITNDVFVAMENVKKLHDTTLSMLLASLNIKQKVLPLGPAFYGAAIIVELWKTDDDKFMIKLAFKQEADIINGIRSINGTNGFVNITHYVKGCEGSFNYCSYEIIRRAALRVYAEDYSKMQIDVLER
ncbi:unnamed protein product [Enterobius vermicularis]|uniref:acid phosphatase n=1 Tax=Enterobius vermicularis TaxID=51028 RepID=A0A0N4UZG6_ENTVE|nr:unnamed protein product [Enterobius vermicularis]